MLNLQVQSHDDECKCDFCGGMITSLTTAYCLELVDQPVAKKILFHLSCHSPKETEAQWALFWEQDVARLVRIVVYRVDVDYWAIYSQTQGRPVVPWASRFSSQAEAMLAAERDSALTVLTPWSNSPSNEVAA